MLCFPLLTYSITIVRDGQQVVQTIKNKMTDDGEIHKLEMKTVTKKMSALYKCVATNKAGNAEHQANVLITGKIISYVTS